MKWKVKKKGIYPNMIMARVRHHTIWHWSNNPRTSFFVSNKGRYITSPSFRTSRPLFQRNLTFINERVSWNNHIPYSTHSCLNGYMCSESKNHLAKWAPILYLPINLPSLLFTNEGEHLHILIQKLQVTCLL